MISTRESIKAAMDYMNICALKKVAIPYWHYGVYFKWDFEKEVKALKQLRDEVERKKQNITNWNNKMRLYKKEK